MKPLTCQVAIIGGGPTGLSTAIHLRQLGVDKVLLIEREATAGGIPRHCGHSPFGLREFKRVLSGPSYARRLAAEAVDLGVELLLNTTVVKFSEGGRLTLSTPTGEQLLQAEKIVICTGNRESPRAARLVSGSRPPGIVTTGALQSMVYLKQRRPFKRPVIIGTELVSFSALLTCRHAGIKPVAMIESNAQITALRVAAWLPRLMRVPLLRGHALKSIAGQARVESVDIEDADGKASTIACDGVLFTGQFVAEASLVRASHLQIDARSGGPLVDQYGRCSDPDVYAGGNLLHPVDTAGWCWSEGRRLAGYIHADLTGKLPQTSRLLAIESASDAIQYFTPQRFALPQSADGMTGPGADFPGLQLRFKDACRGQLRLCNADRTLSQRNLRARAQTRQILAVPLEQLGKCDKLSIEVTKPGRDHP